MSDKSSGMKSAYELALERLDRQGIERPDAEGLGAEVREGIGEARRRAEAKLAELEILHRDELRGLDPATRAEKEREYHDERRRVEESRDREIARLRGAGGT